MFKRTVELNERDKQNISEMCGKIIVALIEGRSTYQMSNILNMQPHEVEHNIDEMLYTLRTHVGKKRYIKTLFRK